MKDKKYRYWKDKKEIANQLMKDAIKAEMKTFDFYTQWGLGFSNGKEGVHKIRRGVRFFDIEKQEPPEFVYQSEIDKYRDILKEQGFLK